LNQDRWDRFANKLDEDGLRQLLTLFEIFRVEVVFVLDNVDIRDEEPFDFLKRLSAAIQSKRDLTVGYDEVGSLCRFLWEVFAGWSFVTGYRGDVIKEMIDSI